MKTKINVYLTDYSIFKPDYAELIKIEQKNVFEKIRKAGMLNVGRKWSKRIVILSYIHTDFGKRTLDNYAIVVKNSASYNELMQTDDYTEIGKLRDFVVFFNANPHKKPV